MNDASNSPEEATELPSLVPSAASDGSERPPRASRHGPVERTPRQDEHYWRGVCEERGHIACEMHDGLFAHLNAAALRLQNAMEILHAGPTVTPEFVGGLCDKLTGVHRLLHFAVAEMRGWLRDQPPTAGSAEDLESALVRIADEARAASAACHVQLTLDRELPLLPARTRWELVRVGQEALRNAVRHGHASSVELRLQHFVSERLVQLRVQDDGCGFDPFAPHKDGLVHFGLRAMRSRVERLGGRFSIESRLQIGTVVTATIPAVPLAPRSRANRADLLRYPSLDH